MAIFVDSNVLLDVMTEDATWMTWSAASLAQAADRSRLVINAIVFAEISVRYTRIEDLEAALPTDILEREAIPFEAGFLAAKAFASYRNRGGQKTSTLPDFLIGAHAALSGYQLLTRDATRYRTYFPTLKLICP